MATVFLTGGTGFLGTRLIHHLCQRHHGVIALHRTPLPAATAGVTWVRGDIADRDSFEDVLPGVDTVIHAAAMTGKASPSQYHRTNTEATRHLLDACAERNVRRFLFVSSVAAGFAHRFRYHYAHSKLAAEAAVRASGLDALVVRPTMLMGPESPVAGGLAKLATLPVVPLFGSSRVDVQPIHVDDAARAIVGFLTHEFNAETVTLGGPEQIPLRELLDRLRQRLRGTPARFLHIPWSLALPAATLAELLARPFTPLTAGQLATFRNDGIAPEHPLTRDLLPTMQGLDAMIADSLPT